MFYNILKLKKDLNLLLMYKVDEREGERKEVIG